MIWGLGEVGVTPTVDQDHRVYSEDGANKHGRWVISQFIPINMFDFLRRMPMNPFQTPAHEVN